MGFRFRAEGLEIKAAKPYSAWMMSITPASPIDLGRPPAGVRFQGDVVLFGCLFLTLVLAAVALMLLLGHVELTKNGDAGSVFTGFGALGWTRRFQWSDVSAVREAGSSFAWRGTDSMAIRLEGRRRLSFGSWLSTDGRRFMLCAIHQSALLPWI
jgi:hypothetical protein